MYLHQEYISNDGDRKWKWKQTIALISSHQETVAKSVRKEKLQETESEIPLNKKQCWNHFPIMQHRQNLWIILYNTVVVIDMTHFAGYIGLKLQGFGANLIHICPSRQLEGKSGLVLWSVPLFDPDYLVTWVVDRASLRPSDLLEELNEAAPVISNMFDIMNFKSEWLCQFFPSGTTIANERDILEQLTVLRSNRRHPSPWGLHTTIRLKLTVTITPSVLAEEQTTCVDPISLTIFLSRLVHLLLLFSSLCRVFYIPIS